jgi:Glycosyltransferase like family 2
MSAVAISIVIPVRMAQHTVVSTLEDLLRKCASSSAEVIAVVSEQDPTSALIRQWPHPQLRVIVCPGLRSVPQLRREGVLASSAALIAISEDHCLFPANWIERQMQILSDSRLHVCGGPVDNGRHSWVGWAQYFSRYCAFLPPGREGQATALPGNNACYLGSVLRENAGLFEAGFWEAELNRELLRRKYNFWFSPDLSVYQRQQRGLTEYAALRFRHGQSYAARKMRTAPPGARLLGALRSPAVPFLLYLRGLRAVVRRRRYLPAFLAATPLLLVYFIAWSLGEGAGSLFGGGREDTD